MNYKNPIFVESLQYSISELNEYELKFAVEKNLIKVNGDKFISMFVGEFITPENSYFSVPKNIQPSEENINLFKEVLKRYKDLKGKDGKTLLSNNSFSVVDDGQIKSEKFFFYELKEFFLDYVTYHFIYPKKKKTIHSTTPLSGGKIDIFSTVKKRAQKGSGITYKVRDISGSDDWILDKIYYSTLLILMEKYGTKEDRDDISDMVEYLKEQGYKLSEINIEDITNILNQIRKSDIDLIHNPIKNTLIDFYESKLVGEKFSINAFYTLKFQYVWEEIVRDALSHNENFKDELKKIFTDYRPTKRRFGEQPIFYRDLMPDLFSRDESTKKCFIGDAKYYKDPENTHFDKEMYIYNQLLDNKYPMCVFVPSDRTKRIDLREQGPFELIVFRISVRDAIDDAIHQKKDTLQTIQDLIMKNTSIERKKNGNF